jgi:hypothetical protein
MSLKKTLTLTTITIIVLSLQKITCTTTIPKAEQTIQYQTTQVIIHHP